MTDIPVVVGHGSCLQMLGCAWVHQGAAPLVFSIVPCICDMYNVITRNTQRRGVTMRLHAEINTHIERVGT